MRGADKLLELIDGIPQITRITQAALATGCPTLVVLPPDHPMRAKAIADLNVTKITIENAVEGMAASIREGVARAGNSPGLMILPADMPDLETADLQAMVAAFAADPHSILRGAAQDGNPGHPIVFPREFFPDLAKITGDEGARAVLKLHVERLGAVPLPGNRAVTDLDTPEEWAAWRSAR